MRGARQLSLRPYNGSLYVCKDEEAYQRMHKKIFGDRDVPLASSGTNGRFAGGCGPDGKWAYLIWFTSAATLAHELSHCILHVFERCGIDPSASGGEPFCYLLSQLMIDSEGEF